MVIARFYEGDIWRTIGGVRIEGAKEGANYHCEGWFPIESFDFGFADKSGAKDEKTKTPTGQGAAAHPVPPKPTNTKDDKEKKDDAVTMGMKKKVDKATCDLMWLAMKHRNFDATKGESGVSADVHVLSSVQLKGPEKTPEITMFASLMFHIEGVLLSEWSVSVGSSGRPDETIKFKFDKVAMRYVPTKDGSEMEPVLDSGWDQKEGKMWPSSAEGWEKKEFNRYTPTLI